MTDREDTEQLALAYVYGELEGEEAKQFEARLAGDAELRAEVDGLVATREMLDGDVAWGAEQGVDEPPPHLVDAILRAEAIARPKEIREAQAAAEQADKPFVQRLSMWILGGGAALTAAATLLLFVTGKDEMATADAALPGVAAKAEAPAAEAIEQPEAEGATFGDGAADKVADESRRAAEEKADREQVAPAREPTAERDLDSTTLGRLSAGGRADDDLADEDADDGFAGSLGVATSEADGEPQKPRPKAKRGASRSRASGGESAGGLAESSGTVSADPAAKTKDAYGYGSAGGGGAAPGGSADAPAEAEAAPEPKPTAAPSAPAPPPVSGALKKVLKQKGAKKARRSAPTTRKERKKSELKAQSGKMERQESLTLEVATGQRELSRGRPANAIGPFRRAQTLDPSGKTIGTSAVVGLMRAHHMLKDYRRVLDYVPQLMRFGLKAEGVGEALLLAADSAERLGRIERADQLYADAAKVKKTRARALRARKRMNSRSFDMEDAAAAEAPAADEE